MRSNAVLLLLFRVCPNRFCQLKLISRHMGHYNDILWESVDNNWRWLWILTWGDQAGALDIRILRKRRSFASDVDSFKLPNNLATMIMTSTDQFVDPSIQPFLSFHSHLITRMYRYSMMRQELIHNAMMMIVLVNIEFRWGSCWNRTRRHGVIHYTTWLGLVSIRWIWDRLLAFLLVKVFRLDDSHKKRNETTPNPFTWTPLLNYFVTALNIPQHATGRSPGS